MTAAHLGSFTIGVCVPAGATAAASGTAGITTALPLLFEQAAALAAQIAVLTVTPPNVDFGASLDIAIKTLAAVQLAISTPGLSPPSIDEPIQTLIAALTSLQARIGSVQAQLSVLAQITELFAVAGLHIVTYDGALANLGSEIQGVLGPVGAPSAHSNAVLFVTTSSTTWDACEQVFKVTP